MKSSMLSGKTALVTGSTSGIGLVIARALAEQGANIVFNGFGDARHIRSLHTGGGAEFGVQTEYHNAYMSKPAEIGEAALGRVRHAGRIGRVGGVLLRLGGQPGARRGVEHERRQGRAVILF